MMRTGTLMTDQQPEQQRPHQRHDHRRRYHTERPKPAENAPAETAVTSPDEEEDEDVPEKTGNRPRFSRGRPPKKIIEEWANDIYCN